MEEYYRIDLIKYCGIERSDTTIAYCKTVGEAVDKISSTAWEELGELLLHRCFIVFDMRRQLVVATGTYVQDAAKSSQAILRWVHCCGRTEDRMYEVEYQVSPHIQAVIIN